MTFPSAYSGVKKIYAAEIMTLISMILVGLVTVFAALAGVEAVQKFMIPEFVAGILTLVSMVLIIIAYILNLIGLGQAGKDERKFFRTAFILSIILIVLAIVSAVIQNMNVNDMDLIDLASRIIQIIVSVFTICGIMELAKKLNRSKIVAAGSRILILWTVIYAASIVTGFIKQETVQGIIAIVSFVLMIVAYCIYLSYLGRACRMLRK